MSNERYLSPRECWSPIAIVRREITFLIYHFTVCMERSLTTLRVESGQRRYACFTLHDRYHCAANLGQKQSNRGAIAVIAPRNPAKNAKPSMTAIVPRNPVKNTKRLMTAIGTRSLSSRRKIRPKRLSDGWQRSRYDRPHRAGNRAAKSGQKRYATLTAIAYKFLQG